MGRALNLKGLLIFSILGFCGTFFADEPANFKDNMKITFKEADTPTFTMKNVSSSGTTNGAKWGLINVEIQPEKKTTKNGNAYFDDVEMEVQLAIINGKKNDVEQVVLFSGKVEYHFIERDGKKHDLMALIPGAYFKRYATDKVTPAKGNVRIEVKLVQRGKVLAVGYYSSKSMADKDLRRWFMNLRSSKKVSLLDKENTILPRSATPWEWIDFDKYEYEKQVK